MSGRAVVVVKWRWVEVVVVVGARRGGGEAESLHKAAVEDLSNAQSPRVCGPRLVKEKKSRGATPHTDITSSSVKTDHSGH